MTPSDHREYKCYAIFMLQFWIWGSSVGGEEYNLQAVYDTCMKDGTNCDALKLFYFQVVILYI
jgi:hypothetical protein